MHLSLHGWVAHQFLAAPCHARRGPGPQRAHALLLALTFASSTLHGATLGTGTLCSPYGLSSQGQISAGAGYLPFSLAVGNRPASNDRDVYITGDEVIVTKEYLGNLIKLPNAIDANLKSLTIDARRVILRGPLAFADAKVTLLAHELVLEQGGVITLVPAPGKPLTIVAETIYLQQAKFRHFDVRFRKSKDDFADIDTLLRVQTQDLRVGNTAVPAAALVETLVSRFTLQALFDFSPKVSALNGAAGLSEWQKATKAAAWPQYTLDVWRAGFQLAPFDLKYTTALSTSLTSLASLLGGSGSAKVLYDIGSLRNAIASGVDLKGNGPAWAPVVPLSQLRRRVQDYTTGGGKGLKSLEVMQKLIESAATSAPPNVQPLLAESHAKVRQLTSEQRRAQVRLAEIAGEIASVNSALKQDTDSYQSRENALRQHARDLERGAQSRQQLVSGLATAVSIVATAYSGSPQVGALAGGVVVAVGASGGGKKPVESLAAGYQFYSAIESPLKSSKAALENMDAARKQYASFVDSFSLSNITIKEYIEVPDPGPPPGLKKITRDQALSDLGAKGNAVLSEANGLIDVYKKFSPQPAPIPAALEEDYDIKTLAAAINVGLNRVKELTLEMEALQRSATEFDQQLVAEAERCALLASLKVTNEEERRAVLNMALSLVRGELSDFVETIANVRRVSFVEYRADLPVDLEEIRRMFVAAEVSKAFEPFKTLEEAAVLTQYAQFIGSTRTYVELLANRVDRALESEFSSYVGRRGMGPALAYPSHTFKRSWWLSTEDAEFIRRINRNLEQQFESRRDPIALRELSEQRIPVPFDIRDKVSGAYPVRFIQAALVGARAVKFGTADDIAITVELSRVGNFRQRSDRPHLTGHGGQPPGCDCRAGEDCYSVDYRAKESSPDQYFWWRDYSLADVRAERTMLRSSDLSFWYLDPSDTGLTSGRTAAISYPSGEAEMFVRVRLDSRTERVKAPTLTSLTLKLEVFQ